MAKRKATAPDPVQAFIFAARQQFLTANEAETENRKQALLDQKFLNLEQWPDEIKAQREVVGQERPCLTIDQIGEPYRQLTNKVREARSAIKIVPEDGEANEKTADRLQELVRGIEYSSDGQIAYITAFEGAGGWGWGYAYLSSDYEDATKGRDQVIKINSVENPFAVWIDPAAKEPDRSDMRFAFIAEAMPMEAYKQKYPESVVSTQGSRELFQGVGLNWQDWFPEGRVVVAAYYYRDDEEIPMVELADGTVLPKAELPRPAPTRGPGGKFLKATPAPEIAHEWVATKPRVLWCKINGVEVLEGNPEKTGGRRIPGTTIPIRPCYGQTLNVNGVRVYRGIVRAARDPQQMYNYNNSALVEDLALVPKSKIILAEGQEEGHEGELQQSLSAPTPYIRYKPTALGDKLVPPPQVAQFTDPAKIQALALVINQNKADLRSTLSYYDPSDPSRKNTDQSGKAILARSQEMDQGSTGYLENYSRFLTSLGKLMLEWIPEIYDRPGRLVRGLDTEDNPTFLMLNQPYRLEEGRPVPIDPQALALGGQQQDYEDVQPGKGKFGVRVALGKSFLTQKQEAAENGLRLMEVLPNQAPGFADLVVRNLDGPGNDEIADRLERMVPPNVKGDDQEMSSDPEALKAQLQQAGQAVQERDQVIQQLQEAIKTDQVKVEGDLQKAQMAAQADTQKTQQQDATKVQIAQMDNETKLAIEQAKIDADFRLAQMKHDADLEKARITAEAAAQARREGFAHDDVSGERSHVHTLEQQAAKPSGNGASA